METGWLRSILGDEPYDKESFATKLYYKLGKLELPSYKAKYPNWYKTGKTGTNLKPDIVPYDSEIYFKSQSSYSTALSDIFPKPLVLDDLKTAEKILTEKILKKPKQPKKKLEWL